MTIKINSIQYLRAIASILVVYDHCVNFVGKGNSYQASFYFLKTFGAIGVDIFFVISGFIISYTSININGYKDSIDFLKKRFVRINPSYYFASIVALILRFISKPKIEFPNQEVLKSITIMPIFDVGYMQWKPILYVGWTLAYEWLFYLIFSVILIFSIIKKNTVAILMICSVSILGFIFPWKNIQYQFITNAITLEFCLGVIVASMYLYFDKNLKLIYPLSVLIVGLIWYGLIIRYGYGVFELEHSNQSSVYFFGRFLIWGVPSAFIVFGFVFFEKKGVLSFKNKLILLLGESSFSIYLIHTIFISFINKFYVYLKFIPLDILIFFVVIIGSIIGVIYYKLIEMPILKYFNSKFFQNSINTISSNR